MAVSSHGLALAKDLEKSTAFTLNRPAQLRYFRKQYWPTVVGHAVAVHERLICVVDQARELLLREKENAKCLLKGRQDEVATAITIGP